MFSSCDWNSSSSVFWELHVLVQRFLDLSILHVVLDHIFYSGVRGREIPTRLKLSVVQTQALITVCAFLNWAAWCCPLGLCLVVGIFMGRMSALLYLRRWGNRLNTAFLSSLDHKVGRLWSHLRLADWPGGWDVKLGGVCDVGGQGWAATAVVLPGLWNSEFMV